MRKVIVATRRSELALAQCRQFVRNLVARHPQLDVEELHVTTTGDRIQDRPLAEIGGKGLFLKEIEEALLARVADFAVHSLKDVPPSIHPDLQLACIPAREDPRDVLVTASGATLRELKEGFVLGTSSLRRALQLSLLRPDLRVTPLRGNVGSRLRKCQEGEVDATVLARAGLNRLGLAVDGAETLEPESCLPAVGQGALAIEVRREDTSLAALLMSLEDPDAALVAHAERALLGALEGDCRSPIAGFGIRRGEEFWLRGLVAAADGSRIRRDELVAPWPTTATESALLGRELGQRLRKA